MNNEVTKNADDCVCKNCKFYRFHGYFARRESPSDSDGEVVVHDEGGVDIVVKTDAELKSGLCLHPAIASDIDSDWLYRDPDPYREDGIFAGSSEKRGYLNVGPAFGCIHFEKRD